MYASNTAMTVFAGHCVSIPSLKSSVSTIHKPSSSRSSFTFKSSAFLVSPSPPAAPSLKHTKCTSAPERLSACTVGAKKYDSSSGCAVNTSAAARRSAVDESFSFDVVVRVDANGSDAFRCARTFASTPRLTTEASVAADASLSAATIVSDVAPVVDVDMVGRAGTRRRGVWG